MRDAHSCARLATRVSIFLLLCGASLLAFALTLGFWPGCASAGFGAGRRLAAESPSHEPELHRRLTAGACDSADDLSAIRSGGIQRFESDMEDYGLACIGRGSCVAGRFQTKRGYSPECAACHGGLAQCTRDVCFSLCILGRSAACVQCATDNCNPSFGQCTGDAAARIVLPGTLPWVSPSPPPPPAPPPNQPSPPSPPPAPSPPALPPAAAPGRQTKNIIQTNVPGVGEWGGTCSCPDGAIYNVGDNNDGCGSLACVGGVPGPCTPNNPGGAFRRVTCAVGPPLPPPQPPPPPAPPPFPPPLPWMPPAQCPACPACAGNANGAGGPVVCAEGLGGSACQLCTSNAGCAALSPGQTFGDLAAGACTPGLLPWHRGETQRGYDCAIQGLGTLSASCAVPEAVALDLDLGGEVRISCDPPSDTEEGAGCGEPAPTACAFTVARLGATLPATCSQTRCAPEGTPDTCETLTQACPPGQPATSVRIAAAGFVILALALALLLWGALGTPAPPKFIPSRACNRPGGQIGRDGTGCDIWGRGRIGRGGEGRDGTGRDGPGGDVTGRRWAGGGGRIGGVAPPTVSILTTTPPNGSDARMASAEEGRGGYSQPRSMLRPGGVSIPAAATAASPPASPPASSPVGAKDFASVKQDSAFAPVKSGTAFPPLPELLNAVRLVPSPSPALAFHITVVPQDSPALLTPTAPTSGPGHAGNNLAAASSGMSARPILAPVRLRLQPAETHGVFGPSGSGKSTLLSALAGDPSGGLRVDGEIWLGGVPAAELPRGTIGYCAQDDVLTPSLTAYESVLFAATLCLPRSVPAATRQLLAHAILSALGLGAVMHKRVGGRTAGASGLSGGERRRVSLGLLLASAPAVLLVDEPTSGLDASSALLVATLLRDICASSGRTAVVSVHQPSSRLFATIDNLLLLAKGQMLYRGPRGELLPYLLRHGLPAPAENISLADHMLELTFSHAEKMAAAAVHTCNAVNTSAAPPQRYSAPPSAPPSQLYSPSSAPDSRLTPSFCSLRQSSFSPVFSPSQSATAEWGGKRAGVGRVARELVWRCGAQLARDSTMLRMQLGVAAVMAVAMGLAFLGVDGSAAGFQNKAGAMQITLTLFAFGGLSMLPAVASEWCIVWREWHAGFYSAWLYSTIKLSFDLLVLRVLPSVLFGAIFYALVGLRPELPTFLLFQITLVLANCVSGLYCSAIGAAFPQSPGAACLLGVVTMLVSITLSGLNLNHQTLPQGLRWLPKISFCSYAFEILLTTELQGTTVLVEIPGAPAVRLHSQVMLDLFGLHIDRVGIDLLALAAFVAGAFVLNAAILAAKLNRTIPKLRQRARQGCAGKRLSRPEAEMMGGTLNGGTLNGTLSQTVHL